MYNKKHTVYKFFAYNLDKQLTNFQHHFEMRLIVQPTYNNV